jgi:hypothetical protein
MAAKQKYDKCLYTPRGLFGKLKALKAAGAAAWWPNWEVRRGTSTELMPNNAEHQNRTRLFIGD